MARPGPSGADAPEGLVTPDATGVPLRVDAGRPRAGTAVAGIPRRPATAIATTLRPHRDANAAAAIRTEVATPSFVGSGTRRSAGVQGATTALA